MLNNYIRQCSVLLRFREMPNRLRPISKPFHYKDFGKLDGINAGKGVGRTGTFMLVVKL